MVAVHPRRGQSDRPARPAMVSAERWQGFTRAERVTILEALIAAPVRHHDSGETEDLTTEILSTL